MGVNLKFKSLKLFLLIITFGQSSIQSFDYLKFLQKKDLPILAVGGLAAVIARYAYLEYFKPNENTLTGFYRNRTEKNIYKFLLAAGISIYSLTEVRKNPQILKNLLIQIKDPANLQLAIALISLYPLIMQAYKFSSFTDSSAKLFKASDIKERFSSVEGAESAKEELQEVITFLKNPELFEKLGTKIRRGVLLTGSPGNGKTLLAKAVAGEANCPFLQINGSQFIELFVGMGASRMRNLFNKARNYAPCIIFIDEIDAIGGKRQNDVGFGAGSEYSQTLNELLAQMDGFEKSNAPIILIGATNRPEMLDAALLRPGRFDSKIKVELPHVESREKILKIHAKNYKINPSVDFKYLAKLTIGFSGAELANLINEASHIAAAAKREAIVMEDFNAAYDKITLGKPTKIHISQEDRKITAYHEAGHALVQLLTPGSKNTIDKVTILPRGHVGGFTRFVQNEEVRHESREDILNQVKIALGGRVAEQIIFGKFTGGACSDIKSATELLRRMICELGMSQELGPVYYQQDANGLTHYSVDTGQKIDEEIRKLMKICEKEVHELLSNNKVKLEKIANALLELETLTGIQVKELVEK